MFHLSDAYFPIASMFSDHRMCAKLAIIIYCRVGGIDFRVNLFQSSLEIAIFRLYLEASSGRTSHNGLRIIIYDI